MNSNHFFLVWCPTEEMPKTMHPTLETAKNEAMRLAKKFPSREFFVMNPIGVCKAIKVEWIDIKEES